MMTVPRVTLENNWTIIRAEELFMCRVILGLLAMPWLPNRYISKYRMGNNNNAKLECLSMRSGTMVHPIHQ